MTNKEAYYFIGHSLALGCVVNRHKKIIDQINADLVDWDKVIYLASNHLVLPTLYVKYRDHNVLPFLPIDLQEHLVLIHRLNFERNNAIIAQARKVKDILKKENIEPIFLKGCANIFDHLYSDIGERMMLDIDFLVNPEQINRAAELLKEDGYDTYKGVMFYEKSTKHYPRLTKSDEVVDIEIHFRPVSEENSKGIDYHTIKSSQKIIFDSDWTVPCDQDKLMINFLHAQLENAGYRKKKSSMRELYDGFLLTQRVEMKEFSDSLNCKKAADAYFGLMSEVFGLSNFDFFESSNQTKRYISIHNYLLNHPVFHKADKLFIDFKAAIASPKLIIHRLNKIYCAQLKNRS